MGSYEKTLVESISSSCRQINKWPDSHFQLRLKARKPTSVRATTAATPVEGGLFFGKFNELNALGVW